MKLSILDQSPIRAGVSPDVSIRESIALAQHCEALGYARYWVPSTIARTPWPVPRRKS